MQTDNGTTNNRFPFRQLLPTRVAGPPKILHCIARALHDTPAVLMTTRALSLAGNLPFSNCVMERPARPWCRGKRSPYMETSGRHLGPLCSLHTISSSVLSSLSLPPKFYPRFCLRAPLHAVCAAALLVCVSHDSLNHSRRPTLQIYIYHLNRFFDSPCLPLSLLKPPFHTQHRPYHHHYLASSSWGPCAFSQPWLWPSHTPNMTT